MFKISLLVIFSRILLELNICTHMYMQTHNIHLINSIGTITFKASLFALVPSHHISFFFIKNF